MNQHANTMDNSYANGTFVSATRAAIAGPRWHGGVDSTRLGAASSAGRAEVGA